MPTLCVAGEGGPPARGATLERRGSPSRRWSIGTSTLGLLVALVAQSSCPAAEMSRIVAAEGRGYLEQVGGHLVLHVAGTPYEMGWQHGRLLRNWIGLAVRSQLENGEIPRGWRRLPRTLARRVPPSIIQEANGLADGAGLSRDAAALFQLLASVHLSESRGLSVAAWGVATADHRLYHAHVSTPAAPFLCTELGPLFVPLLVVARPSDGLACIYPSLAGFVGASGGMNAGGVTIACLPNAGTERLDRGPLPYLTVREALHRAATPQEAQRLLLSRLAGHGHRIIVSSPARAVVLDDAAHRPVTTRLNGRAANVWPHWGVPDTVRRSMWSISPGLLAARRRIRHQIDYRPHNEHVDWALDEHIVRHHGRLDPPSTIRMALDAAASTMLDGLVVYCPSELAIWSVRPERVWPPDSTLTARVLRLPVRDLLADRRVPVEVEEVRKERDVRSGVCRCEDTLPRLSDPDPKVNELLQGYNFPADPFPWRTRQLQATEKYRIYHVTFPSPQRFDMLECNIVHAEYYLPETLVPRQGGSKPAASAPAVPGLIVLHILDGRFIVARMVCRNLAAMGIPCLMVQMPYYGDRRPRGVGLAEVMLEKPERMFDAMQAAVPDIRRAACWLQDRPEVDPDRIGLLGVSLGAVAAAIVAGVDQRFNRNVLVIGGGDPATLVWSAPETRGVRARLTELGYTRESLAKAIRAVDPITFAHRVNTRQVLMINATNDKTIPKSCTIALWEAMGKPAIRWHAGGHYSMGLYTPVILSDAYNFIRNLPADTSWR